MKIKRFDDDNMTPEESERFNEEMDRRENQPKGSGSRRDGKDKAQKRYVNFIPLEKNIFFGLASAASSEGLKMEIFCAKILSNAVENMETLLKSKSFRMSILQSRADAVFKQMDAIDQIAARYNENPSDDLAELLAQMCDEAGIDPEVIKSKVRNEPFLTALADIQDDPNSKTSRCKKWMIAIMKKNNYRVDAKTACADASRQGFNRQMLCDIRKALNIDSVEENAVRVWVLSPSARAARSILEGDQNIWSD